MSRIPQNFLDDLLNRVDIVEIIDHRVKLKRTGKNYSACCPFHDEKTPSFTVSPDKQFYYCFGCGASGTAISFLMEYDRSDFVQAVESLAKTAGVQVPREENLHDNERNLKRKRCYDILHEAANYFQDQLREHPQKHQAVKYLQNRGLSGHIAKAYGLGYAPPGWDNLLSRLGQNESRQKLLFDTGLTIEKPEENKRYDRFRHRIMFPIRDGRGREIGFGGRVLGDDKPKYLNSPETDVFHKGQELYGLYEAKQNTRKLENLIVVEGYMDVIALAQYGLWNAVATLGTACGEDHLKLAFRHVNEVIFCFDGDRAGRSAAKRGLMNALTSMSDGRQIRFLFLSEGQDPDSLIRQIGAERFQEQLKNALPLEEFLFDVAAEGVNLNSMDGRARFSKIAAPLIHQLPEGIFQSLMMENLAKRTGLSLQILSEFTQIPEELTQPEAPQVEYVEPPSPTESLPQWEQGYEQALTSEEPYPHPAPPIFEKQIPRSKLNVSPARNALILLLDHPQLLQQCKIELTLPENMQEEEDIKHLLDLVSYLRKRPNANFNNIMGFWGGVHGVEAQQSLAKRAANQIFGDLKSIDNYDGEKELAACFEALIKQAQKKESKDELAQLTAKGLSNLNINEKKRYVELIRSS